MTWPRLQALKKVWETSPTAPQSLSWIAQTKGMKVKRPRKGGQPQKGAARELYEAVNGRQ